MESQDKEKEYEHNVWGIFCKEWAIASSEKKLELDKQMLRWQALMKSGLTASQAYIRVMGEQSDYGVMAKPSEKRQAIPSGTRISKAPFVFLSLALAAAIVYGVLMLLELGSTKSTLTSMQSELSSTKQTLASTQAELASTKQTLSSVQQASTNLQATLSTTQQQLAAAQDTLGGLGITLSMSKECYDVALIDNPTAKNPTWSQLMTFLYQDQTETHTYIKDVYDCSQFSRDVHNNAEARGIRAAVVQVKFKDGGPGHALNAFRTIDRGLVYVDCTGKGFQELKIGEQLSEPASWDKIAYVVKGKELGSISLGKNTPLIMPLTKE